MVRYCVAILLIVVLSTASILVGCATPTTPATASKIAFFSGRDGTGEIYVISADGTGQARLTDNSAEDHRPVWSPIK